MILYRNEVFLISLISQVNETKSPPLPPYKKENSPLSLLGRLAAGELFELYFLETQKRKPKKEDFQSLKIEIGEHGKPFLADYPSFFYNISHSGQFAAACFSPYFPVGIDIEKIRPYQKKMAERLFSEEENRHLCETQGREKDILFTGLWTKIEAKGKAAGNGLTKPISSDDFELFDCNSYAPKGYCLSVALQKKK